MASPSAHAIARSSRPPAAVVRPWPRRGLVVVVALALLAGASGMAAARSPRVPQGFAGVVLESPVFPNASDIDLGKQLDQMVAGGVESLRVQFDWAALQPYRTWQDVPAADRSAFTDVDGLPLQLGGTDRLMEMAASRGLSVHPLVINAPVWNALPHSGFVYTRTPRLYTPYATFVKALVHRYGPRGSFWSGRSRQEPIHEWQVWNEPNFTVFWAAPHPEQSYALLLKLAHAAIKHADPTAQIVLAGLANDSWNELRRLYAVRGLRSLFDIVAIHPYTRYPRGVVTILRYVRAQMDRAGDRKKPIVADEVGWNSSLGKSPQHLGGFETTEKGQAQNVGAVMSLLAAARGSLHLLGFDIYEWATADAQGSPEFDFAGLFRISGATLVAKPAFGAYKSAALALEHCRRKSSAATRCAVRS